jgi:hypothetical protein
MEATLSLSKAWVVVEMRTKMVMAMAIVIVMNWSE